MNVSLEKFMDRISVAQIYNKIYSFFDIKQFSDLSRIFKLQWLFSLEIGKGYMMAVCGCEVDELNNWVSHAIREPYYWRTAADGTRFVAGPYSPLWYVLNWPSHYGYWVWMSYLLAIDVLVSTRSFWGHGWKYIVPYAMASIFFYDVTPIDYFIFIFTIIPFLSQSRWSILGPVLGLATKLPWPGFAPDYVFSFIFNNPYGINEPGGWFRYLMIGTAWVASVSFYIHKLARKRRDSQKSVK